MCPPAPAQTHRCPKLAFQEKFCTAAFTTPIGPYDHYKRFTHNHERIDINLTAEARHRCLNGDTNVNGLFKLTPFKEKHHRLIASIERRLRWAITEIEEGTGPGNFQEPRLDPAVCAHDPDHRAQSKTSQKTDGVGQTQTQTQISTTCATNNTPITSKVTAAKQTEGRDVATANPSSKVTSHEKLKRTGNLSRPPSTDSAKTVIIEEDSGSDIGELGDHIEWEVVDEKEAVGAAKLKKAGWGPWASGWKRL